MTTEPDFVGAGRHAVVDGLVEAYDRIRAGGPATWIALEAPSGWGKTRVLREFYRRLAAERQAEPAYWPADVLDDDAPDDVSARRKRVVPDVVHRPGSLPSYLWWGVTCAVRGGAPTSSLRHDLAQVHAHADFLEDAWRDVAPSSGRWKSGLRDAGVVAADEAAMEVAGTAVESVLGAAVPGLGLVRWLGERGVAGVRAAAQRRDRLASSVRVEASDLVTETAAMLGRLAVPGLPIVIVVEDVHAADAALCELLTALVTSDAAVLVVATSWPGTSTDNVDLAAALAAVGDRAIRLDHHTVAPPDPFGPAASLAQLETEALASIVRHSYPQVYAATLDAIVERYPNPLTLELFCHLPRVRRRGRSGALRLDPDVVATAPAEIRGLYQELWNELPETVREALSLAALGIPSSLDPAATDEWNTDLLLVALADLDWPALDEIGEALHTGGDAYAWARSVSSMLRAFNEPDQRDIAALDDSFLFDDDRVEVRTAIGAALGAYVSNSLDDLDGAERHHLAELAVVLHAEGFLTDADVLVDAVRASAESALTDQRDLPGTLDMLTRVIDAVPSADRSARAHLLRGHANLSSGRLAAALADAEAAVRDDAPDLFDLEVRNLRARTLAALRRGVAAVDAYEDLVVRAERILGADHPDTLAIRAGLAEASGVVGRGGEAIGIMSDVVERTRATLGADDPYTLAVRNGLATLLVDGGHVDAALDELRRLAADCHRLLGPDHPRTLTVGRNLAYALLASGDVAEAVTALRVAVAAHHRVLGAIHPDTFRAERLLGRALTHTGNDDLAQEGVDVLTGLHEREVATLGRDHPEVQGTLAAIANVALRSDEYELAIDILRRRMSDLEADHERPDLSIAVAQSDLAHALAVSGRFDEAIELLGASVIDLVAIDAAPSVQLVTTRQLLARTVAESGELDHALEQMRLVAADATTLWGPVDERTVDARDDIARALLQLDRRADARAEWTRIAADVAERFGPDHQVVADIDALLASLDVD